MAQKQQSNLSTHLPEVAGNVVDVTGSIVVDTGLRNVRTHGANLNQAAGAASAYANSVLTEATGGANAKLTLQVREDDGVTLSSAAASVSWFAIGE